MTRGLFIVFEGLDRSGKSTQSARIMEFLQAQGVRCEHLHFPIRTTTTGLQINDYLTGKIDIGAWDLMQLFAQNRREQEDYIVKTLNTGRWIVCDRYAYSGVAYATVKQALSQNESEISTEPNSYFDLCKHEDAGLPAPDLIFFLDVPADVVAERGGFGDERFEEVEFQNQVYQLFPQVLGPSAINIRLDDGTLDDYTGAIIQHLDTAVHGQYAGTSAPVSRLW